MSDKCMYFIIYIMQENRTFGVGLVNRIYGLFIRKLGYSNWADVPKLKVKL